MNFNESKYFDAFNSILFSKKDQDMNDVDQAFLMFLEQLEKGTVTTGLVIMHQDSLLQKTTLTEIFEQERASAVECVVHRTSGSDVAPSMQPIDTLPQISWEHRDARFLKVSQSPAWVWLGDLTAVLTLEEVQRVLQIIFSGIQPKIKLGWVWFEGQGQRSDKPWGLDGPTRSRNLYPEKAICSMFEQTGFSSIKIAKRNESDLRVGIANRI